MCPPFQFAPDRAARAGTASCGTSAAMVSISAILSEICASIMALHQLTAMTYSPDPGRRLSVLADLSQCTHARERWHAQWRLRHCSCWIVPVIENAEYNVDSGLRRAPSSYVLLDTAQHRWGVAGYHAGHAHPLANCTADCICLLLIWIMLPLRSIRWLHFLAEVCNNRICSCQRRALIIQSCTHAFRRRCQAVHSACA